MDKETKQYWDRKYEQGLPSLTKPDPFFVSAYDKYVQKAFAAAGSALDLAGGLGRHTLWLAQQGWRVTIADISEIALRNVRETSAELDLDLEFFQGDAADFDFQPERFDVVVLFYHLDRQLFPKIMATLKPGGLFVCKMRVRLELPTNATAGDDPLLDRDELMSLLPRLVPLHRKVRPLGVQGVLEYVGAKS